VRHALRKTMMPMQTMQVLRGGGNTGSVNEAIATAMAQLQDGAQKWSDLQDIIAACIAFQKCLVRLSNTRLCEEGHW